MLLPVLFELPLSTFFLSTRSYLFKHCVLHCVHINNDVHYVHIMHETMCTHCVFLIYLLTHHALHCVHIMQCIMCYIVHTLCATK